MPTYDYRCNTNGRVLEVSHRMSENLNTWGELCRQAGVETGDTPADAPVQRLATGGNVISSTSRGRDAAPPCASGHCCPSGGCNMH
ncbi:zinc ribbon domain-containing protein [uncultured Thiodictyon sp.]|uniref:zinc ribbon domain-containing protein n=1 Tax=uncultured Thiodictyon sp. TaxID=1846217 RepID=UPI0025D2DF83|nr:zinc ribbon domain-containing protein [uncultured Thiodictyon sp.]